MRPIFTLLVLLLCLCAALPSAHAAKAAPVQDDAAFVKVILSAPIWSTDPLRINFITDGAKCRQAYGEDWWRRCSVALGSYDAPAAGVELLGAGLPAGEWRWDDFSTLIFTPQSAWQPDTAFSVDLKKLALPLRVKLDRRVISGSTLPLAGQSPKGEVWIDPSLSGARAVSFALRFTAPVDKSLEQAISLKAEGPGVTLGKTEFVWGQDKTSCLVKAPLTALPGSDTVLTMQVQGVRTLQLTEGKRSPTLLGDSIKQTVVIPGKKELFRVNKAALSLETNEHLQQEFRLKLSTSLRVPHEELLKALKVVELPRLQNPEATEAYNWEMAPVIAQTDLDKARPLKLEVLKGTGISADEREVGETVTLRVPVSAGKYVYCYLPEGFGAAGYTLAEPWSAIFQAYTGEGKVEFLQPGNVLTLTPNGDNRLDMVSYGVDEVQWRAGRIKDDNLNLLQLMTNSEHRFTLWAHYVDSITSAVEGKISLSAGADNTLAPRFSTVPLSELMGGNAGLVHVELKGMRQGKEVAFSTRLVLVTDLGMVSKLAPDGSRQVYVCSLSSGQPVQDAVVRILALNGQTLAEARSNAEGYALLPAVRGLTREKSPVALVASRAAAGQKTGGKGADLAWMALDDSSRRVDYSRFPTEGQISSPENINAYVFGQRGIFRPGEELHFGVILRRGDWQPLPADMPLLATLTDPAGSVVMRRNFTVAEGLTELSWLSQQNAPTGRYRLDVSSPAASGASADILGSGVVRVEEFQPDTLAIRAELIKPEAASATAADKAPQSITEGWVVTSGNNADVALAVYLRNFYGSPAAGRKVRAEFSVKPAALSFVGYEDFTFPDILPFTSADEQGTATRLPDTVTTAQGQAQLPLPLANYQNRTMECRLLVEGFEADGGRAVTSQKSFIASPLPVMLGYRLAGAVANSNYVPQGTRGGLEFVALGPDLRPAIAGQTKLGQIRLSVAERRYTTLLATDAQGKYVYEDTPVDKEISVNTAKLDAKGCVTWAMPTDKAGEFLLTVRDEANRIMARIPYTVAGNDDVRAALKEETRTLASTQLRLRLDKADYAAGDTVNLFLAAPYEGIGLITLERDRVAQHVWFKAPAGHSVHSLVIPNNFEGRGYINVTMGRAIGSPEIFMQPHSFAVAPLTVNAAGRDMGLHIEAPRTVLPGTSITAKLTARKPGKALVFAVDEGVLQLTRFSTPDPLRYLLLDRALEVKTDQLFDLLMPVHSQLGKRLPAFGGDMHMGGGRFQNPFKRRNEPPLAWWSGLVETGPQGTELTIPVPAYTNSQIRLMAVAVSAATVGSTEASTVARAPLVISPQMPLMAAPGDSFEGGIGLHNTTDKSLAVRLQVEHKGMEIVKGQPEKQNLPEQVEIAAGKEEFLPLQMVAGDMPGEASLTVRANIMDGGNSTGAGQEFRRSVSLSVRPAVLPRQEQRTGFAPTLAAIPADGMIRALYPFKADATAALSAAPLPPLRVLLRSLAAYPYTCVEQRISRAFPLVLLQRRPGMAAVLTPPEINGKPRAEEHARMLQDGVAAIRAGLKMQGLAPWPDTEQAHILLTAYAGDYLLSMREAGMSLPGDLSTNLFVTLERNAGAVPDSLNMARAHAYALWVLTRHGLITAPRLVSMQKVLDERWPQWKKDVTATLMAGSYALMNMHDAANQLLNAGGEGLLLESENADFISPLGARALHVTVLARHFPDRLADRADRLATLLLEGVNSSRGATLEAALGARALMELAVPLSSRQAKGGTKNAKAPAQSPLAGLELRCTAYQEGFSPVPAQSPSPVAEDIPPLLSLSAPGCTQFSLSAPSKNPLYWEVSTDGYDRTPPAKAVTTGMEVSRTLKLPDGTILSPKATVEQGTVLRVELVARVFGREEEQVVLADLLPGGFELLLTHPDDTLPQDAKDNAYNRLERREDRVLAYATVGREPVTFVYHVRAVNRGQYTLPAVYGESLYDRAVYTNSSAGTISVQ